MKNKYLYYDFIFDNITIVNKYSEYKFKEFMLYIDDNIDDYSYDLFNNITYDKLHLLLLIDLLDFQEVINNKYVFELSYNINNIIKKIKTVNE